jgi:ribose transport system substrate-binding protein
MSIIIIAAVFSIFYFRQKLLSVGAANTISYEQYDKHYAVITSSMDSPFWESVYEETKIEAKKYNAYVEYLGKDLSVVYDVQTLLRIAIDCKVDGIIVEGNESPEVAELINDA